MNSDMVDYGCVSEAISQTLNGRQPKTVDKDRARGFRHAGVLLPLLEAEGICKVLFTERTHQVEHHKGQISFPGGAVEADDASIEATVLRETHEEIGLLPKDVHILGRLDDALTLASNFVVHPLVGMVASLKELAVNPAEVEKVITVPLAHFVTRENRRSSVKYEGVTYETLAYECGDHLIWGATARMVENFMQIMGPKFCLHQDRK